MSSTASWPCAALERAELASRTTLRVGGEARWLLEPRTPAELGAAFAAARERGLETRLLGGGANLLVEDGLHECAVIATERLSHVFRPSYEEESRGLWERGEESGAPLGTDARLVAWAGASLPGLVRRATELGWSGLEGLAGVPGRLGGGVTMNAGGRWGELWEVVESVCVVGDEGGLLELPRAECAPRYRDGNLGGRPVAGAVLRLRPETKAEVHERVRTFLEEKRRTQPVTEASAGCIFKNPDPERSAGRSAGALVEEYGLKGLARGPARVSPLHGNFIVNEGGATAADVLGLVEEVRERIAQASGIRLETEVRVWRRGGA